MWKNEKFTVTHKEFRQIIYFYFLYVVKPLLSRNFCQISVTVNLLSTMCFHIIFTIFSCNWFWTFLFQFKGEDCYLPFSLLKFFVKLIHYFSKTLTNFSWSYNTWNQLEQILHEINARKMCFLKNVDEFNVKLILLHKESLRHFDEFFDRIMKHYHPI